MFKALSSLFKTAGTAGIPNWNGYTPVDTTIHAIGDVHGYPDALADIYKQIDRNRAQIRTEKPNQKFIEVGMSDVTDRGPGTREALDLQIARYYENKRNGITSLYVAADHEYLLQAMLQSSTRLNWKTKGFFDNGGLETLRSYGVTPRVSTRLMNSSGHKIHGTDLYVHDEELVKMKEALWSKLPLAHAKFLGKAVPMIHLGSYTFVHAAVNPEAPIDMEYQDIRVVTGLSSRARDFPKYTGPIHGNRVIVRAHAISEKPVLTHNQIGIDTGIFTPGGKLTCAILQDTDVSFIQATTRLPPYSLDETVKKALKASEEAGQVTAFRDLGM
jgi:serine/threonine protein phosphatase 1